MSIRKHEKFFTNSFLCNFIHRKFIFPKFFQFINKDLVGKSLEIGCGSGETTKLLSKEYPKLHIHAIDNDKEQINTAKKRQNLKNVVFNLGDATKLDFNNSTFDYLFETNSFHHIKDYQRAIRESYRVLKKNGRFYVMDIGGVFSRVIHLFLPQPTHFTPIKFAQELKNNGFTVEKMTKGGMFFIEAKK